MLMVLPGPLLFTFHNPLVIDFGLCLVGTKIVEPREIPGECYTVTLENQRASETTSLRSLTGQHHPKPMWWTLWKRMIGH